MLEQVRDAGPPLRLVARADPDRDLEKNRARPRPRVDDTFQPVRGGEGRETGGALLDDRNERRTRDRRGDAAPGGNEEEPRDDGESTCPVSEDFEHERAPSCRLSG